MKILIRINNNIKIGIISSIIAALFFYYILDPIQDILNNILIKGSLLFFAYMGPLFDGTNLHIPQNPEIDTSLFYFIGICSISLILISIIYFSENKLDDKEPEKFNPGDSFKNKILRLFQNMLLFTRRWFIISLTMIIFLIAIITIYSFLFPAAKFFLF